MHQSKASTVLNVIKTEPKEEQTGNEVALVAKKIKSELNKIQSLDKSYPVLNNEILMRSCADTLQSLFLSISPKFQDHLKVVSLVSSMINTVCNVRTSMLQVALSSLVGEKRIIEHYRPSGMIGVTTKERSVKVWAHSHHLGELASELEDLRQEKKVKVKMHKEELPGRIKSDAADRLKLRDALVLLIHPLKVETHSENKLVNIYDGEEAGEKVNVTRSVEIGEQQMITFQESLPEGFRATLSTKVVNMTAGKKTSKNKENTVKQYNTDLIMSRVLYLLGNNQLDLEDVFKYELAPVPMSMFENTGEARYAPSKSDLMNKLKIEVSTRGIKPETVVIDGGGMLHSAIYWPKDGNMSDLLTSIDKYLSKFTDSADVYTVFDRYFPKSIKSDTRLQRVDGFRRVHHIGRSSPLPGKDICMASTKTKQNLIEVVSEYILEKFSERAAQQKFVVTSNDVLPEETIGGTRRKRTDLETHYDEADYIIPQQVNAAVKLGHTSIKVISADTDFFVLLCYHYLKQNWSQADIYLENFQPDKGVVSIKRTVEKHSSIIPSLTALHAISGCDSVPKLFGIGKAKALTAMKKMPLNAVGNTDTARSDVIEEGKMFVAMLYGVDDSSSSHNK